MKINHAAIWVRDLEKVRDFYVTYFQARSNELYHNPQKGFKSYFLSFPGSEVRLELMHKGTHSSISVDDQLGYAHIAFSVGSKEKVEQLTQQIATAGYSHLDGPRTTGDGYYESVVEDPEGNKIEITI